MSDRLLLIEDGPGLWRRNRAESNARDSSSRADERALVMLVEHRIRKKSRLAARRLPSEAAHAIVSGNDALSTGMDGYFRYQEQIKRKSERLIQVPYHVSRVSLYVETPAFSCRNPSYNRRATGPLSPNDLACASRSSGCAVRHASVTRRVMDVYNKIHKLCSSPVR